MSETATTATATTAITATARRTPQLQRSAPAAAERPGAASAAGARQLIHRPRSWEHRPLSVLPDGEEEFVLTGELPGAGAHPLFGDGPGAFHDLQTAAEMLREVSEFIGRTHFGIPAHRTGVFYRFAVATGDIGAWRTGAGPARLTTTLRVRPDKVIDAVPRALEFRTDLALDGMPCGGGSANVVFLPPMVLRGHREHARASAVASAVRPRGAARTGVEPDEVGRADPGTVLLHDPTPLAHGRLAASVSLPPAWPLAGADTDAGGVGHVSALVQLETLRQASLLAAGRARGLAAPRSTLASLRVHFRGYAEPDLPLRCAAVAGLAETDGHGRRRVPVTLTLAQSGRAVLEAVTTVVEDH